jgi:predicted permease
MRPESFLHDLKYGARVLRRSPAFSAVAVLSLALGIGATAAVFSLADAVLVRELPVRAPRELVTLTWVAGKRVPFESLNGTGDQSETETSSTSFSLRAFRALQARGAVYADVFGFADMYRVHLSGDGHSEVAGGHLVSGNFFAALGVVPALGRPIVEADDRAGAPPVVMISHSLWQQRYGGAEVGGRTLTVNGVAATMIGVLPPGFRGVNQVGDAPDVLLPLSLRDAVVRGDEPADDPHFWWVVPMARLRAGITAEHARGPLDLIIRQTIAAGKPDFPAAEFPRLRLAPGARGQAETRRGMRDPLRILTLVVAVVFLVACANVANLLLARGRARGHELAIRAAIGADRPRMIRQLLTEGALLCALGACGGLFFARWLASALLPALTRQATPLVVDLTVDRRLLLFTIAAASASTLLAALARALRSSRVELARGLRDAGRNGAAGRDRATMASALVIAQVALCLVLAATAGLLAASLRNLQHAPLGFDPSNVLLIRVDPTLTGRPEAHLQQFYTSALERVRALPGARSASLLTHALLSGSGWRSQLLPPGTPRTDRTGHDEATLIWRQAVDARFFDTMNIPLLRGRLFDSSDHTQTPRVVVVTRNVAERFFPGQDAVGQRFSMSRGVDAPVFEVVGVVGDHKYASVRREMPPIVYEHYRQRPLGAMTLAVKTRSNPLALADAARRTLAALDPAVPTFDLRTQEMQLAESIRTERLFALLAILLGTVVLLLAAIGLYGVVAYSVERRTSEIGIRMALGAERSWVRRMVLRESLLLAVIGVIVGVPAARAGTHVIETLLFGLEPGDPAMLAGSAALLVLVALAAAYVPARRASNLDPLVALRTE